MKKILKKILLELKEIIRTIYEEKNKIIIVIIVGILIYINSIIYEKEKKPLLEKKKYEIIKKIELVLNRENNENKDLILEELEKKSLEDVERYYNRKLFDTEFNIKVIKE